MTVSFSLVSFRPPILPLWKCLSSDSSGERVPEGRSPLRVSPQFSSCPPRVGVRGLKEVLMEPSCALDSRLRGNDKWGVQRGEAPLRSFYPPRVGVRELKTDSMDRLQGVLKEDSETASGSPIPRNR
jgi:hypothetical protein